MKAVILAGGQGSRLDPEGIEVPKPLALVNGVPLTLHLMNFYASQGVTEFLILLGHKGEEVQRGLEPFVDHFNVKFIDTGATTSTGGRLLRAREHLKDKFFLSYCDSFADIDLRSLVRQHEVSQSIVTLTAARVNTQYGIVKMGERGEVISFREKPLLDAWVSAGFFVCEERIFTFLSDDSTVFEKVLEKISDRGDLGAYRHSGLFRSVDTPLDLKRFEEDLILGRFKDIPLR